MKITSPPVQVLERDTLLFKKLENVSNFEYLMPNNLAHFSIRGTHSFSFALKGMPEIFLEKKKSIPSIELIYGAPEDKLPFILSIQLNRINEVVTQIIYTFEGNFNPVISMMVKAPITKLLETMAEKTKSL
ncbi:hypothetical protein [Capnocytophaga sp. oral taxon 338]|uniref:hypothetical protein n=1 Tax=Capnocytophaga sp. oral taxon 338 TaxID=710239 RepID=UPI000202E064|nr:hypothetical protein [Capnocytophaga sp. oral taxon 338]EGD34142.1 orotate phosphoribosyltransferase [Capnocytophaga sp. oral taxon 338 str. F0234]